MAEANRDQAVLWNEASGRTWVEMQPVLDRMLEPLLAPLIATAAPRPGERVLDIGCGAGASALAFAREVAPGGSVLGVDISAPLVAAARARAADLDAVSFEEGDAQVHPFKSSGFDLAVSRFGVMFFDDPVAAFANLRRAVRPGGRLAFVAWRSPAENAFLTLPARAAAEVLPPMAPVDPEAPGQFAFADPARVRGILEAAGWDRPVVAPLDVEARIDADDLPDYVLRMGSLGQALRSLDPDTRARASALAMEAVGPHVRDGAARFTCACWQVTANG